MLQKFLFVACIALTLLLNAIPPSQATGLQKSNWLEQWLSGPLPGQPQKSVTAVHRPQTGQVRWPVPPNQRRVSSRNQRAARLGKNPSLKGKPGEQTFELPGMYLGIGTVLTSGTTDWNHDATSANAALGNPSSELTYEDVSTLALEVTGHLLLDRNYFIRGNLGLGLAFGGEGNLRDDDFLAGQTLFSSTDSAVPDSDLFYFTLDVGREIINLGNGRLSVSLFTGYQYWQEEYQAFGLYNLLTGQQTRTDDVAVISNVVEWQSLRVGVLGAYSPDSRTTWTVDLAFIPYTSMHNEDSHLLRTGASSLGPAPNVIMDGSGYGFEGAIGLVYYLTPRLASVFDFRYWRLTSDGEITLGPNADSTSTFPLNALNTVRYGVNAGLRYSF
jgi:outer membrane protease